MQNDHLLAELLFEGQRVPDNAEEEKNSMIFLKKNEVRIE